MTLWLWFGVLKIKSYLIIQKVKRRLLFKHFVFFSCNSTKLYTYNMHRRAINVIKNVNLLYAYNLDRDNRQVLYVFNDNIVFFFILQ